MIRVSKNNPRDKSQHILAKFNSRPMFRYLPSVTENNDLQWMIEIKL